MPRKDLSTRDISEHAAGELEMILSKKEEKEAEPTVSVEEAMAEKPVFKVTTDRDVTRVLFISTEVELLDPTRQTLDGYVDLSDLFDEVHVLVLRIGIPPKNPVLRASANVWIYTVAAAYWWELPGAGMKMVDDQLSFAAGFRPDLIVARDPYESAWLANKVAKKYHKPTQLHVVEDFTIPEPGKKNLAEYAKRYIPLFTIKNFSSVRTLTDSVAAKIKDRFDIDDLKVLPRLQNYESLISATTEKRLSEKYQGFSIFLLYVGKLSRDSGVFKVLEAVRFILRNKRIGLVIVGDGPAKMEVMKKVRSMKVERQVMFEKPEVDLLPYIKGAHILIVPDTDVASEETVLKGAASGIPLLISQTEKRNDVFADKYSAYFINPEEPETISSGVSDLLNDVEGRMIMAKNAQTTIAEKFHFDPTEYQAAYRLSIEEVLFLEQNQADDES